MLCCYKHHVPCYFYVNSQFFVFELKIIFIFFEYLTKYELICAHDLRRSFATNYFSKVETPILMQITGHSKESNFLKYVRANPNKDAVADVFMERFRRLGNESG